MSRCKKATQRLLDATVAGSSPAHCLMNSPIAFLCVVFPNALAVHNSKRKPRATRSARFASWCCVAPAAGVSSSMTASCDIFAPRDSAKKSFDLPRQEEQETKKNINLDLTYKLVGGPGAVQIAL